MENQIQVVNHNKSNPLPSLVREKQQSLCNQLWEKVKVDDLKLDLKTFKVLLNDPVELIIHDLTSIERFTNAFNYIVKVYYGLNHLNVANEVIRAVLTSIKENYPDMTFSNLNLCFVNGIEKKQGSSLTRDEFMLPIHAFMSKKKRIESLLQDVQLKEHNERIEIENAKKFVEHSMSIYNESKGQGKFIGTPFEANVIVDEFIDLLTDEELNECQYRSKLAFKELTTNNDVNPFTKLVKSNRNKGEEIEAEFKLLVPERHLFAKEVMDLVIFKNK